jgi:hypothetical protein
MSVHTHAYYLGTFVPEYTLPPCIPPHGSKYWYVVSTTLYVPIKYSYTSEMMF